MLLERRITTKAFYSTFLEIKVIHTMVISLMAGKELNEIICVEFQMRKRKTGGGMGLGLFDIKKHKN